MTVCQVPCIGCILHIISRFKIISDSLDGLCVCPINQKHTFTFYPPLASCYSVICLLIHFLLPCVVYTGYRHSETDLISDHCKVHIYECCRLAYFMADIRIIRDLFIVTSEQQNKLKILKSFF